MKKLSCNCDVWFVSGIMLSRDQRIHLTKEDSIMGNLCFHESFLSNHLAYT